MSDRLTIGTLLVATLAAGATACGGITHLDRNAPGDADIHERPDHLPTGERIPPDDPGEQIVEILGAPYYGFGQWNLSDGRASPTHTFGLEFTAHAFDRHESHSAPMNFFGFCPRCTLYPAEAFGATLGAELLQSSGEPVRPDTLYLQGVYSDRMQASVAAGWSLDTRTGRHGPRLTLTAVDFLSIRLTHHFGGDWTAAAYLRYTYGEALVWSR